MIRRLMALGTVSSYLRLVVRIVVGLVTFRLLFQRFDPESFGFYQLLWSTIGYLVLLDFGFGMAVQKAVARAFGSANTQDLEQARGVVTTVCTGLAVLAAFIGVVLLFCGEVLLDVIAVPDAIRAECTTAGRIFVIGLILGMPLGVFREVMRADGRMHWLALVEAAGLVVQGVLITWGCLALWSLPAIMLVATASALAPVAVIAIWVCRDRRWRPRWRSCRLQHLGGLLGFSLTAYFITMTNVVMGQTDQLAIGTTVSLAAIALFLPGFKLAGLVSQLAGQLHDVIGPLAAAAASRGDQAVRQLFLCGQLWGLIITIPLMIGPLIYAEVVLGLLIGADQVTDDMVGIARVLVLAAGLSVIANGASKRVLVMTERHRVVLWISIAEAVCNLGVSLVLLLRWRDPMAAAVGTLSAQVLVSVIVTIPVACRYLGISLEAMVRTTWRGIIAVFPAVVGIMMPLFWSQVSMLAMTASIGLGVLGLIGGSWFGAVTPEQRHSLCLWFRRRLQQGGTADVASP